MNRKTGRAELRSQPSLSHSEHSGRQYRGEQTSGGRANPLYLSFHLSDSKAALGTNSAAEAAKILAENRRLMREQKEKEEQLRKQEEEEER